MIVHVCILLSLTHFLEDCEWKDWSEWSLCTVTCDGGKQVRSRKKIPAENNGKDCVGTSSEERDCSTDPCKGNFATYHLSLLTFFHELQIIILLCMLSTLHSASMT